uniref:Uncharacterized protein n=1 Tax=Thermogemmatispora argillosa TaxID=2045280 RepID=A0A455SZD2_9CHLR|nr:hypothetical protein KTA_04610 [Thermogemmatispora argillosa]
MLETDRSCSKIGRETEPLIHRIHAGLIGKHVEQTGHWLCPVPQGPVERRLRFATPGRHDQQRRLPCPLRAGSQATQLY